MTSEPGVDVGGVVMVVDEREAESVDGGIGAGKEDAVDELGVELAGVQRRLVRREELVVKVDGGDAGPEGAPFARDEGGLDGVQCGEEGEDVEEDLLRKIV